MNIYLKTIILSLFLLFLCPERCFAAEPEVLAGCHAEWMDEENGIARVTLTQSDLPATETAAGTTDYIFMIDGSRTTALNDSYLFQKSSAETEPTGNHCPCMADGHYYLISGVKVLPITYTLGYECDTGRLRTWSAERMLWSDSAGAHYNGAGKKIPIRYANGCLDIFTIFKNVAVKSVEQIAKRQDHSRVAFIVYSGGANALYGVLDYTENYEDAVGKIRKAGFQPGSLICPGIDKAMALCETGEECRATKLLMMGDGRNSDIGSAVKKAETFRSLPGTAVYTACMGMEACIDGDGCQAMKAMSGNRADRFWRIQTRPQKEMAEAFAAVLNEEIPVAVGIDGKKYSGRISGEWEYYEDAAKGYLTECSAGSFSHTQDRITWLIPKNTKGTVQCSFYVRLQEEANYISEAREYDVLQGTELSYVIRGGSRDGAEGRREAECNPLKRRPSGIEVTQVRLQSGIFYQKQEDVLFVKGGSANELCFTSYTKYAVGTWKPEKNFLYVKSDNSGQQEVFESGSARSEDLSHLTSTYPVTLYIDGERCEYYPSASIGQNGNQLVTERFDETKKLTLICDAVPPHIENPPAEIIREDQKIIFTAEDDGSGVQKGSFCLEVLNSKTGEKKVFRSSGTSISWNIRLEDSFYCGNLNWVLKAQDNVGNSTVLSGVSDIRASKGEEEIADEIRTRILLPRSDFSVDGIH